MATQKIWATRWALTKGIYEKEAKLSNGGEMATYKQDGYTVYLHGKDFHLTEVAAREHANAKVAKKIASMEKQLVKLRKLTF